MIASRYYNANICYLSFLLQMFVYSKLSPHINISSANYRILTQTVSLKNNPIITQRKFSQNENEESSNRYNPVSPILGIVCGLLAALFYFKKKEIEVIFFQGEMPLQVASCLDKVDKTEFHNKQRPVNSLPKRDTLSKELKEALKRTNQKLLVFKEKHVLAVKSNNAKGSRLMVHIRDTKDETGESIRLLDPYRVIVGKSAVHYDYPLKYLRQYVNNQLRESQPLLIKKSPLSACNVDMCPGEKTLKGKMIPNSKGFCCNPTFDERFGQRRYRRGFSRKLTSYEIWQRSISYCPRYSPLWYSVYKPGPPMLRYNIEVKVQRRSGKGTGKWETVDSATLSSAIGVSRLMQTTADIKVEGVGSLFLTSTLPDLSSKILLIPTPRSNQLNHKQVKAGAREWLLVDASRYERNSYVCNKLGSEFRAFVSQPRKCYRSRGSCFQFSPLIIWQRDKWAVGNKTNPIYFPSAYGKLKSTVSQKNGKISKTYLRYLLQETHTTEIRLEFRASNVSYVLNVATGRIVDANAEDFHAFGGGGEVKVTVVNSGHLTSTFMLSLENCDDAVLPVGDRSFELNPSDSRTVEFVVSVTLDINANYSCQAVLRDSLGKVTDSRQVTFAAMMSCYCPVTCGCLCSPETGMSTKPTLPLNSTANTTANTSLDMSMLQSECFSSESLYSLNITYVRPPCYICFLIKQMQDPVKIIVTIITLLLTLGVLKMLVEDCLCRDKERRRRRFVDSFLGSKSKYHKRHQVSENTVDWFLGACFFLYLPCLVCIAPLCRIIIRKKREKRDKLREDLNKYRTGVKKYLKISKSKKELIED
ncbi:Protein HAPLESS 2-like [Oopsacas minuta]|uniref:Protein HAPLESS 2-like n=1 Tax=Oopsacas minuta TaxID=111878 RepID=A0AAV7K0H9_9METZ|nr:Protein HAPLESS 2-like [Oopsacas minuta]